MKKQKYTWKDTAKHLFWDNQTKISVFHDKTIPLAEKQNRVRIFLTGELKTALRDATFLAKRLNRKSYWKA